MPPLSPPCPPPTAPRPCPACGTSRRTPRGSWFRVRSVASPCTPWTEQTRARHCGEGAGRGSDVRGEAKEAAENNNFSRLSALVDRNLGSSLPETLAAAVRLTKHVSRVENPHDEGSQGSTYISCRQRHTIGNRVLNSREAREGVRPLLWRVNTAVAFKSRKMHRYPSSRRVRRIRGQSSSTFRRERPPRLNVNKPSQQRSTPTHAKLITSPTTTTTTSSSSSSSSIPFSPQNGLDGVLHGGVLHPVGVYVRRSRVAGAPPEPHLVRVRPVSDEGKLRHVGPRAPVRAAGHAHHDLLVPEPNPTISCVGGGGRGRVLGYRGGW